MKSDIFIALRVAMLLVSFCAVICPGKVRATEDVSGLAYRPIGPAIAGGRVTAVSGTNADTRTYYIGGADGGVFKSTDAGLSWTPVSDGLPSSAIGAIAVGEKNPNDVWVGTGEANARLDVEAGDGVWHSTNGGKTWVHAGLKTTRYISTILIDPRDPNTVIVGAQGDCFRDNTDGGVYVTHDAGEHWRHTLFAGMESGASDVAWKPSVSRTTIFAGIWQVRRTPWSLTSGGAHDALYRSDDAGMHWRRLSGNGLPAGTIGRIGIAVASKTRVYAMIQSKVGALWRSDDGGAHWQKMPPDPLIGHRPFYFSRIYVDPSNPNRVINVATYMSMSTDGGRSFHVISSNTGYDDHVVWWSTDGTRIINGNDTGVILSFDGGRNWDHPTDIPTAEVYHVGLGPALPNYEICVGLQDVNTWCGASSTTNGAGVLNRDWKLIAPGDGMWPLFDPRNARFVWSSSAVRGSGQIFLTNLQTEQSAEISPYKRDTQGEAPVDLRYRFNWETPIAFTGDDPPRTLVGGNVLFSTTDYGQHWSVASPDLTRNDAARQQASGGPVTYDMTGAEVFDTILDVAASAVTKNVIWVSTDDGLVQLTTDGGATWKNVTPNAVPSWSRIPTVEPSRFGAAAAFVVADRHMSGDDRPYVYKTADFGASWQSISGDLPSGLFVRVIRQDRVNPKVLYIGTQRGVFISFDEGTHWQSLRLNMPPSAVYDIELQPQRNDLVVGTHGRGVWILDDLTALQHRTETRAPETFFQPRDAYRMWQWAPILALDPSDPLPRNTFYGPNAPPALFTYMLSGSHARAARIEIVDANGKIVRHLEDLPSGRGMHRVPWDLAEDGPVKLVHGPAFDRGPDEGPEALPGRYTVRFIVDGTILTQPLELKPDPRDAATPEQYERRHAFLSALYDELSEIDRMINAIDEKMLDARTGDQRKSQLAVLKARLSQEPNNELESVAKRPQLRDRILSELGRLSFSFQPPTEADETEAAEFTQLLDQCRRTYLSLI